MSAKTLRLLIVMLLSIAGAVCVAQESPSSDDVFQPEDASTTAALEQQAELALPDTADAHRRCVVLHKRGVAQARLGRYEQSIADLKQAFSLSTPGDDLGLGAVGMGKTRRRQYSDLPAPAASVPPSEFDDTGDWCYRWRVEMDLAGAQEQYGDLLAAIDTAQAAAAEWRSLNVRRYANTQMWLMRLYITLGMIDDGIQAFNRANDVLPEIRRQRNWTRLHFMVEGEYDAIAAYMQEVRGNFTASEKLRRSSLSLAEQYRAQGVNSKDRRAAESAVINRTVALSKSLQQQGEWGEAQYYAIEALRKTLSTYAFATGDTSRALDNLATIEMNRGELAEAARYEQLALTALTKSDIAPYAPAFGNRRGTLGLILNMQGRWDESLAVFRARADGLKSNPMQLEYRGVTHVEWAMALLQTGKANRAAGMLRGILDAQARRTFVPPLEVAQTQAYLGIALARLGNDETALGLFQQAVPVLLQQLGGRTGSADRGAVQLYRLRLVLDAYLELLGRMNQGDPNGQNGSTEAFGVADIARDSSVRQAVAFSAARAQLPDAELAELARREQDDANRIRVLTRLLDGALNHQQRSDQPIASLRQQLIALSNEQTALRQEIARRYPGYASLLDPRTATPGDVQRALKPGEALISIYCGERHTYVWTITPTDARWRVLPISRDEIANEVTHLRETLDLADGKLKRYDVAAAHDLYARLLAPDAMLWRDARTLVVVPHGALGALPFSVLLTAPVPPDAPLGGNGYAAMPWLVRRVAVVQESSTNSFVAQRAMRAPSGERAPFVGFGDPLFSTDAANGTERAPHVRQLRISAADDVVRPVVAQALQSDEPVKRADQDAPPTLEQSFALLPALPDTADELTDIARTLGANREADVFLGARASKANVKRTDLSRYRVVAFATHGLKAGELAGLDQPALAMANPALTHEPGDDGFLKLEDVFALRLNADWVVLSACNTASPDGGSNEAVSGLGRGFFYAGARSVLVSNWAVESHSARMLTTALFREQAANPQLMRAEALRRSMLHLMDEHASQYGHPAFWAPFTLVGSGG